MEQFPSNSQQAKKPVREAPKPAIAEKKIEKVVTGEVIVRKRSLARRVRDTFLGTDDGRSVGEHLVDDILIPNMRDLMYDLVLGGLERTLYGDGPRPNGRRGGTRFGQATGRVNYGAFSQSPVGKVVSQQQDATPSMSRRARAMHDFDEILFPNRPEAERVLEGMFAILDQYEQVKVIDLYELTGISSNFTDGRWGWTNLLGSRVERDRNGYFRLALPPTEQLER